MFHIFKKNSIDDEEKYLRLFSIIFNDIRDERRLCPKGGLV